MERLKVYLVASAIALLGAFVGLGIGYIVLEQLGGLILAQVELNAQTHTGASNSEAMKFLLEASGYWLLIWLASSFLIFCLTAGFAFGLRRGFTGKWMGKTPILPGILITALIAGSIHGLLSPLWFSVWIGILFWATFALCVSASIGRGFLGSDRLPVFSKRNLYLAWPVAVACGLSWYLGSHVMVRPDSSLDGQWGLFVVGDRAWVDPFTSVFFAVTGLLFAYCVLHAFSQQRTTPAEIVQPSEQHPELDANPLIGI